MDKIRKWLNTYSRQTSLAMMVLAGVFFLDTVYQIQMHLRWRFWMPDSLAVSTPATRPAPMPASPPPQLHASIRKRNIFMEAQPRGHGVSLTGVMGSFALFSGRGGPFSLEEGKSANSITLKAIRGYEVTIEYQGKTEVMKLFNTPPEPGPGPAGPSVSPGRGIPVNQPAPIKGPAGRSRRSVIVQNRNNLKLSKSKNLNRDTQPCTTAP